MFIRAMSLILLPLLFFLSINSFALDDVTDNGNDYTRIFGVGSGSGWIPNYPGSKKTEFHYMFFPFYEGKVLKMDQNEGVRNEFIATKEWNLGISYVFNFPVDSTKNIERLGMPNLNWLVQAGPQVRYHFINKGPWMFSLLLAIQVNIETTFWNTWKLHGLLYNPGLRIKYNLEKWGEIQFRYEFNLSTSEYQNYYYGVSQEFATVSRPSYNAKAGWQSLIIGFIYSYPWNNWVFFTSPNYYHYGLGENRGSPLHSVDENFAWLIGFTYKFGI